MKSFRFRLERVLEWRRRKFDQALALQEQLRLEQRQIENKLWNCRSAMPLRVEVAMSGKELSNYQAYLWRLQKEAQHLEERRSAITAQLQEQTQRVLEANRNVKILEGLREKRLSEWNRAADKELEGLAADVISNRWTTERLLASGQSKAENG